VTFDEAFEKLIGHEGGYQTDHNDRGNWTSGEIGKGEKKGTKYGISAAAYPSLDIANMTMEQARHIYKRDYWGPAGCDAVPPGLRFDLFDFAVNSGIRTAIKTLQKAVGTVDDGILGPKTLQAIGSMPETRLRARFNGARLEFMTTLWNWPTYGRGWARRIAANLSEV
jgi:lysozyme family protein